MPDEVEMKAMIKRTILRNLLRADGSAVDLIIENGILTEVLAAGTAPGKDGFDGSGLYVSSGWIDLHVHAVPEFDPYGDEIDEIGVKQGVTTIVDAGSCGADRIGKLVQECTEARTRLFAFLNISHIGLTRIDELSQLDWIDEERVREALRLYPDFIVGLKARISQSVVKANGIVPLQMARRMAEDTGLPLMVHIGSGPPDIREVLPLLAARDVLTHYLNGKANNLFASDGSPLPELLAAIKRGVHLDVGHGNASFSFRTAEQARAAGIGFDTISTDIYRRNRVEGPVYSMSNLLSKFLYLGYSLEEVLAGVTDRAAAWLKRPELAGLTPGKPANLTLFEVGKGKLTLRDSEGEERTATEFIEAKGAYVNGQFITG